MKKLICLVMLFCAALSWSVSAESTDDGAWLQAAGRGMVAFSLEDEPYPDTYFTFPINSDSLTEDSKTLQTPREIIGLDAEDSPGWIAALAGQQEADQLFVVSAYENTTAWISLHEKDENGVWKMIMSTPGFIGKNGLGKTREGDGMTPTGTFSFNRAFGIAEDPGCAIPYVQADENTFWSGDVREGMRYNELVSLLDYPDLDTENSERIMDYMYQYQYCLNISYNEEGTPGLGSAIFLHCLGDRKPYTGGCVAIPMEQMFFVMQHISPDCAVIIDTMENLGGSF